MNAVANEVEVEATAVESGVVQLCDVAEAARRLGICSKTMHRVIAADKNFPCFRFRGAIRMDFAEVYAYLKEQRRHVRKM